MADAGTAGRDECGIGDDQLRRSLPGALLKPPEKKAPEDDPPASPVVVLVAMDGVPKVPGEIGDRADAINPAVRVSAQRVRTMPMVEYLAADRARLATYSIEGRACTRGAHMRGSRLEVGALRTLREAEGQPRKPVQTSHVVRAVRVGAVGAARRLGEPAPATRGSGGPRRCRLPRLRRAWRRSP